MTTFIGSLSPSFRSFYLSFLSCIPTMSVRDSRSPLRLRVYRLSLGEGSSCTSRWPRVFRLAFTLHERVRCNQQPPSARIRFPDFRHRCLPAPTWHFCNFNLTTLASQDRDTKRKERGNMSHIVHYETTNGVVRRHKDKKRNYDTRISFWFSLEGNSAHRSSDDKKVKSLRCKDMRRHLGQRDKATRLLRYEYLRRRSLIL